MSTISGGFVHTTRAGDVPTTHACNCVGPQNGQPVCPCLMRGVTIENGRYVQRRDLGPVRPAEDTFGFFERFGSK